MLVAWLQTDQALEPMIQETNAKERMQAEQGLTGIGHGPVGHVVSVVGGGCMQEVAVVQERAGGCV